MNAEPTGAPKTLPPGAEIRGVHRAVLGMACFLVIAVYFGIAQSGLYELWGKQAANNYYNLLVQGFRAGRLNVAGDAPRELAGLADPYDPSANKAYLWPEAHPVQDMSYYRGRLYLYFGTTPALVLFWPWTLLTGHYLLHKDAVAIFCAAGFLAGAGLLWAVWRRYLAQASFGTVLAGTLVLGLVNGVPVILQKCDVHEVAISCGYALVMVALGAVWRALHDANRTGWWLIAASLAYGLAVGARPSLLFGAGILLVPVMAAARGGAGSERVWVLGLAALVPIAIVGTGLAIYNALRFGSPFDFGTRYMLSGQRQDTGSLFNGHYLWFNLRAYFLEGVRWNGHFPFVQDLAPPKVPAGHLGAEHSFGVLSSVPLVWLALAAPLAWRSASREAGRALRWFLLAVALLFVTSALTLCFFFAAANRYELEFLPELTLLAVMGILGLEGALTERPFWRRLSRWGWGVLLIASVAFTLLSSFKSRAEVRDHFGVRLFQQGRLDEAAVQFRNALEILPDYAEARNNLGETLLQMGRIDEAIPAFEQALAIRPEVVTPYKNLANAFLKQGRWDDAIAEYWKLLRIKPGDAEVLNSIGLTLLRKGAVDQAIAHYQSSLKVVTNAAQIYSNLGYALLRQGRVADAIVQFGKALELRPDSIVVQNNLAWLLATCPDASVRNGVRAVELAGRANRSSGGGDPAFLGTLAAAYAESGRFAEAVATVHQAMGLATAQTNSALLNMLQGQAELYQAGAPFRDQTRSQLR